METGLSSRAKVALHASGCPSDKLNSIIAHPAKEWSADLGRMGVPEDCRP